MGEAGFGGCASSLVVYAESVMKRADAAIVLAQSFRTAGSILPLERLNSA